jgi:hypothetical protein
VGGGGHGRRAVAAAVVARRLVTVGRLAQGLQLVGPFLERDSQGGQERSQASQAHPCGKVGHPETPRAFLSGQVSYTPIVAAATNLFGGPKMRTDAKKVENEEVGLKIYNFSFEFGHSSPD